MHEVNIANSDDLIATNFAKTGHVTQILNDFAVKAYYITSEMRLMTSLPKY